MAEYIEREALLERVRAHLTQDWKTIGKKQFSEGYYLGLSEAEIMVAQAPTAEVEPVRRGEWKIKWDAEKDPKRYFVRLVCSACGLITGLKSNFCPNCGARMDGGADNG